jgi:tetratricopeptide (TPR) repeat protein
MLNVAMTLTNLGSYYSTNQKMVQASGAFNEALKIYRQLASTNPDAFLPKVAMTLDNLGSYYVTNQKMVQAEGAYTEALKIYRQLASTNPDAFLPDVAQTLNNLGAYYSTNQKMPEAEGAYTEALKLRRQLASTNPDAFLSDVAMTLNNLGVYYSTNHKMAQAEGVLTDALQIYRQLTVKNSDIFLLNVAMTLNNLGVFYKTLKNYDKALSFYGEAFGYREQAILRGGRNQFNEWVRVWFNISEVKDSAIAKKEYANVMKAGQLLAESCDKLRDWDDEIKKSAISEYVSLSWWALFVKDFILAEKAARRCLELDKTQEYVLTSLGHSQLLRGQYQAARATYEKLKGKKDGAGKDYKDLLLQDFQDLEAAGISHKDIARVREEIEKW